MVKLRITLGIRTTSMLILILMFIISGCTRHYIAFGDSITKGFGDDEGEGYPPKLSKMLSSFCVSYKIHNKGELGEDSSGGRKRIDGILGDSDYRKVTRILIQFGTNDTRSDDTHPKPTPVAKFKENLQEIIDRVKAAGKSPLLAKIPVMYAECMPPQSCEPFDDLNTAEYNDRIREYNEAIDQLVWANRLEIEEGCLLIPPDFYAYFESTGRDSLGKSTEFSDNWHPNRVGYHKMAELWKHALRGEECGRFPNGYSCKSGNVCQSGNCVDGFCCASSSCADFGCNASCETGVCRPNCDPDQVCCEFGVPWAYCSNTPCR